MTQPKHRLRVGNKATPLDITTLQAPHPMCGILGSVTNLKMNQWAITIEAICRTCGCYFYLRKELNARSKDRRGA